MYTNARILHKETMTKDFKFVLQFLGTRQEGSTHRDPGPSLLYTWAGLVNH